MASISAPGSADRDFSLAPAPALNATPTYPFFCSPENGYFDVDPPILYDPVVLVTEIEFTLPYTVHAWTADRKEIPLLGCGDSNNKAILTPFGYILYNEYEGEVLWDSAPFAALCSYTEGTILEANRPYLLKIEVNQTGGAGTTAMKLTINDKSDGTLVHYCDIQPRNGWGIGGVTNEWKLGFIPQEVMSAVIPTDTGFENMVYMPSYGIIFDNPRRDNNGPLAINPVTRVVPAGLHAGHRITKLITTHAVEYAGFKYSLVAGAGDTDNALFEIRRDELYLAAPLAKAVNSIRIQVEDRFGMTFAGPVLMYNEDSLAPTDIIFNTDTFEAGSNQTYLTGHVYAVDPTNADSVTLAQIAGDGTNDTWNATEYGGLGLEATTPAGEYHVTWSTARVPSLAYGAPSNGFFRLRATDANGNTFDKSTELFIQDTTAPVITAFTIPATGTSYVVPISTLSATEINDDAVISFMITETDVAPLSDDPGWAETMADYTIQTQSGSGTYTLYAWAKDDFGNVVATSTSDSIDLTIA